MINTRVEVSAKSAEPPAAERDLRKDERHKDYSISQQYWTLYSRNDEFVTRMEVSANSAEPPANSAEPPEVEMDFPFISWTLKIHAYFISTQVEVLANSAEPPAAEKGWTSHG